MAHWRKTKRPGVYVAHSWDVQRATTMTPAVELRKSRIKRSRQKADNRRVTIATIQEALDRLEDAGDVRAALYRCHLDALLCAAHLREAIDRAERWYEQREADLRNFDRRATATVRQLVSDAGVRPSLAWSSP